jgi:hypothetical protein
VRKLCEAWRRSGIAAAKLPALEQTIRSDQALTALEYGVPGSSPADAASATQASRASTAS